MEVAHDYTELTARLNAAGWQLISLKEKGAGFVATGQGADGDKADRLGSTPKMALANLVMFAERRGRMRTYRSSWGTDWLDHHEQIADAYRKLPLFDHKAVPAWRALADESRAQADEIRRQIQVIPITKHNADQYGVDAHSPYTSPEELRKDVRDRKRLLVSTENVDHPVWSPQDVVNFRVTHNVLGVGQSNTPDYSWRGSNMAFQSHAPFLSPEARKALFSEIIGQGAHHEHFRSFSPPRVAVMSDWLAPAEAAEGHHAVSVTPTPVPAAGDPQLPGQWREASHFEVGDDGRPRFVPTDCPDCDGVTALCPNCRHKQPPVPDTMPFRSDDWVEARPGEAEEMVRNASANHQQILDANRGRNLEGLPGVVKVPNIGPLQFHSHSELQDIANRYNEERGLGEHPTQYIPVDPARAARYAEEYDKLQHNPNDPEVKAAYDALKRESADQYRALTDAGYRFSFYPDGVDPYPNSPREAVLDLHHNKHMHVFPTLGEEGGYGTETEVNDHPLLEDSGERWGGKPVTYNDIFRAIHDVYGHAKEGLGFRADGEDNAYRQHAAMFSPLARRALTTETRGQNSWVNYGPHGAHNQTADQASTIYADQKAALMPEWVEEDLQAPAPRQTALASQWMSREASIVEAAAHTRVPFRVYAEALAQVASDAREQARAKGRKWIQKQIEWLSREKPDLFERNSADRVLELSVRRLDHFLDGIKDESYKLIPWAMKRMRGEEHQNQLNPIFATSDALSHASDILNQFAELADTERRENRPVPDFNQIGLRQMEEWNRDTHAASAEEDWVDSTTVHKFPNGWRIDRVGPDDLAREGDIMGHCFPAGTLVNATVPTPIEEIAVGDEVVGHDGKYHRVTEVMERPYEGELVVVHSKSTLPIRCTPEHPILVLRPKSKAELGKWQWRYLAKRFPTGTKAEWIPARDLRPGDRLLSPATDFTRADAPSAFAPSADTAWLIGVYVGDGSVRASNAGKPSAIQIVMSPKDDHERAERALRGMGATSVHIEDHGTYRRVNAYGTKLAGDLAAACGRSSSTKRLPDFLFDGVWDLDAALEGLLAADGHHVLGENRHVFTSTSQVLAQQVRMLAVHQGMRPTLRPLTRLSGYDNAKPSWKVEWKAEDGAWHSNTWMEGYYATEVTSVESESHAGSVYNLEVEGVHSYLVNGAVVHNCVGGYCWNVRNGSSTIYSLRDPKGEPHVTIEFKGQHGDLTERPITGIDDPNIDVVQVQGKGNRDPIPEYDEMVQEWFGALKSRGYSMTNQESVEEQMEAAYENPNYERHGPDHNIGDDEDELRSYYDNVTRYPSEYDYDQEGQLEEDHRNGGFIYTEMQPREVNVDLAGLERLLVNAVAEYSAGQRDEEDVEQLVNAAYAATHHHDQINNRFTQERGGGAADWEQMIEAVRQIAPPDQDPTPGQGHLFSPEGWTDPSAAQAPGVNAVLRYMRQLGAAEPPQMPVPDVNSYGGLSDGWFAAPWRDHRALEEGRYRPYVNVHVPPKPSFFAKNQIVGIGGQPHRDSKLYEAQMEAWREGKRKYDIEQQRKQFGDGYLQPHWRDRDNNYPTYPGQLKQTPVSLDSPDWRLSRLGWRITSSPVIDSILRNGGATLDPNTLRPVEFDSGYMVSKRDPTAVIEISELSEDRLQAFRDAAAGALQRGDYIGTWVAPDGHVHLDISAHFRDLNAAMEEGKRNRQLAIYEWGVGEIPIGTLHTAGWSTGRWDFMRRVATPAFRVGDLVQIAPSEGEYRRRRQWYDRMGPPYGWGYSGTIVELRGLDAVIDRPLPSWHRDQTMTGTKVVEPLRNLKLIEPAVSTPDTLPEHWAAKTADYKTTEKVRKLKEKLRTVSKTDTGARSVAKVAIECGASQKVVREALKGEPGEWVTKVVKEMKTIKRQNMAPALRRRMKRMR